VTYKHCFGLGDLGSNMTGNERQEEDSKILELLKTIDPATAIGIPEIQRALSLEQRVALLEYLENAKDQTSERVQHEPRMRSTMRLVAKVTGLHWDDSSPSDHPFRARLDGALMRNGRRVAVVELEAKNRKQIDGAMLDLLTHPECKKVLVIGRSKAVPYPQQLKVEMVEKVLPVLKSLLRTEPQIGVFTEAELKLDPTALSKFLGI